MLIYTSDKCASRCGEGFARGVLGMWSQLVASNGMDSSSVSRRQVYPSIGHFKDLTSGACMAFTVRGDENRPKIPLVLQYVPLLDVYE